MRLRRDILTFSDNVEVVASDERPVAFDLSHVYEGRLVDDPLSVVHGSVIDGVFEGRIVTDRDTYYVEHAKHYFPGIRNGSLAKSGWQREALNRFKYSVDSDSKTRNESEGGDDEARVELGEDEDDVDVKLDFHSVIYKDEHVGDPYAHKRKGHVSGCGITEEVQSWMDQIQNSAVEEEEDTEYGVAEEDVEIDNNEVVDEPRSGSPSKSDNKERMRDKVVAQGTNRSSEGVPVAAGAEPDEFPLPYQKYTKEANVERDARRESKSAWHRESHERVKRAARPREDNRNTCSLYIQTDPLIWRHIREGIIDVSLFVLLCFYIENPKPLFRCSVPRVRLID